MDEAVIRLLSPIPLDRFLADFYEQRPLQISGRLETHFSDVFSTPMLENLLWRHEGLLTGFVRLHKLGKDIDPPRGLGRFNFLAWAIAEYQDGATIILNNLEDYEPAVARFVRPLEHHFMARVSVSAYASPRTVTAFAPHFDTHDVVILQVEGSKVFNLHEGVGPELPLPSQARLILQEELSNPADVVQMVAGDILYIPRGLVHDAATDSSPSLHLSLGIHPLSVGRLVGLAIERATSLSPGLRRTASMNPNEGSNQPVAKLLALLNDMVGAEICIEELLEQWRAKLIASQRSIPGARLSAINQDLDLTTETIVGRADGAECIVSVDDCRAAIAFPGIAVLRDGPQEPLSLDLPVGAIEALRFIASHSTRFQIGDIPDCLSAKSKVVLVRRLISEGLLVAHRSA